MGDLEPYLRQSKYIDFEHPVVQSKAVELAAGRPGRMELIAACFEFVRDRIEHCVDYGRQVVTCAASDVLIHGTGFCYAKSHLLAALLRANGVAAGLCYQRLSVGNGGPPYCLHGLNAVWLDGLGWFRIDARGNKPGVDAQFCPPVERLAFSVSDADEADFPEVWADPLPVVVEALTAGQTTAEVLADLPDVPVVRL